MEKEKVDDVPTKSGEEARIANTITLQERGESSLLVNRTSDQGNKNSMEIQHESIIKLGQEGIVNNEKGKNIMEKLINLKGNERRPI